MGSEKKTSSMKNAYGEAYVFFKSDAKFEDIERELQSKYSEESGIHPELEFYLAQTGSISEDHSDYKDVREVINYCKQIGMNYAVKVKLKGAPNKEVAKEACHAINIKSNGLGIFKNNENKGNFETVYRHECGNLFFEREGEYLLLKKEYLVQ